MKCITKAILRSFFPGFLILLVGCIPGWSQLNTQTNPNGYNIFYYPNGKVSSEGNMKKGNPDGYWKTYYVTGVMKSEGNRRNSLLDSLWLFYTETGDTLEIINYMNGKKSGYYYTYSSVVQKNNVKKNYLRSKELYLDDRQEGSAYYYFPDGNIQQIIQYKNGKKERTAREFNEKGVIITLFEYHRDYMIAREFINRYNEKGLKQGVWKDFYEDGKVKEERVYNNDGELNGQTKMYSEKGNLVNERTYSKGKLIEEGIQMKVEAIEILSYYDDGKIKRKGIFLDSIPIGMHVYYTPDGKVEKAIRYNEQGIKTAEGVVDENEKRQGLWYTYFETGELRAQGNYLNDRQNGDWTFQYKAGEKEQSGNFKNGFKEGVWTWYWPNGKILREETYEKDKPNGLCVQYSDSATVVAKGQYVEGEREGEWLINEGDVKEEGNYIQGFKNGIWKTYYNDGKLYHKGNFVQGNPDGKHEFFYDSGLLKEEQNYLMGRKEKTWKKFYEDGGLFITITYKNDEEIRINGIRVDNIKRSM